MPDFNAAGHHVSTTGAAGDFVVWVHPTTSEVAIRIGIVYRIPGYGWAWAVTSGYGPPRTYANKREAILALVQYWSEHNA